MPTFNSIIRNCEVCTKEFLVPKYRIKTARFCSSQCHGSAKIVLMADRFFLHVSEPNEEGCQLWTGKKNSNGYGAVHTKSKQLLAHRVAYELAFGQFDNSLHVCHKCDVPLCCAPSHLFLGTPADNAADKVSKGRQARGEALPHSKLNDSKVKLIRELHASGKFTMGEIADQFNVGRPAIREVVSRKRWSHVA